MHKSSLLEIIKTFTPKELTKFEDFVNSPYHNKNKNVINLFAEIKKYAPDFNHANLEKELIWKKVFFEKEYNYGILKNIIHDLTKLCETFVLIEKYLSQSFQKEYDLIESMGGRNIQKFTLTKIDQFEKKVESELELNKYSAIEDYLLTVSHFNFAKENFIHIYNLKIDKSIPIKSASEYTFYFFLIQSFKLINNTLCHELQGNPTIEKTLLEKFFLKLEEHSILEELILKDNTNPDKLSKIIICFYYMYKAISSNGNIDAYNKFKNFFKENIDIFSAFEMQNLNNCRVVCLANLQLSYLGSAKESLDWYKFLLEKGAFFERNGLLTHHSMSNLVSNAVALSEIEFAEKFVEKYSDKLPADYRENSYNYCMALINFGKREFGKSLEYLANIQNEKLMLKYQAKNILLKTYYELNDFESFLYSFDSFTHFQKRNKLANETRALTYNNFGYCVKKLFKLRNSFDKFESAELRKDILNSINKDKLWLLKKLDELEKADI